ncbi:Engulfment and cell motility protein 2 [Characodon lateralis]|uniref:Engulfment and cell motility protein 2 n=1 Tax=Characodon lateralis TaxID=208331 RepID=A0ABU7DF05_9TELE|nr:Engulfment and cell motility protein 2 [Characodon lateralis]
MCDYLLFQSHPASKSTETGVDASISSLAKARAARQLLERIQSHSIDARLEALKELAKLSADPTFAAEFINMEGIGTLARLVESGTHFGEMLAFTLTAFLELMDHGIVSWDLISLSFIKQVLRPFYTALRTCIHGLEL